MISYAYIPIWRLDVSILNVFSCGDIVNCMSKVIEIQLWFLYICDALIISIIT